VTCNLVYNAIVALSLTTFDGQTTVINIMQYMHISKHSFLVFILKLTIKQHVTVLSQDTLELQLSH